MQKNRIVLVLLLAAVSVVSTLIGRPAEAAVPGLSQVCPNSECGIGETRCRYASGCVCYMDLGQCTGSDDCGIE